MKLQITENTSNKEREKNRNVKVVFNWGGGGAFNDANKRYEHDKIF